MKTFVDHTPGISDEGKNVMDQLNSVYKRNRDDFKKAIDEGYSKVEEFFNSNAIVMFQDQTEKMFDAFLNQKNLMPMDLKKTMEQLTDNYEKGCEEFNKHLNENINRMGNFFSTADKTQTNNKKSKTLQFDKIDDITKVV